MVINNTKSRGAADVLSLAHEFDYGQDMYRWVGITFLFFGNHKAGDIHGIVEIVSIIFSLIIRESFSKDAHIIN